MVGYSHNIHATAVPMGLSFHAGHYCSTQYLDKDLRDPLSQYMEHSRAEKPEIKYSCMDVPVGTDY